MTSPTVSRQSCMIFSLATAIIIINQLSHERTLSLRTSVVPFLINKIPPFPRTFQSRFFSKPITDPDLCCSAIKFAAILGARVKKNLLEGGERKGEEKAKCSVFAYVAGGGGGGSKVEGWLPRQPWEPNLIGNSLWPCLPFRQTKFLTLPPLP